MFKKKNITWDKPFSEKIAKRVSKIPTADLETWVDQSLFELGRIMSAYARHREKAYLDEALIAAEALHAVVDELYTRNTSTK